MEQKGTLNIICSISIDNFWYSQAICTSEFITIHLKYVCFDITYFSQIQIQAEWGKKKSRDLARSILTFLSWFQTAKCSVKLFTVLIDAVYVCLYVSKTHCNHTFIYLRIVRHQPSNIIENLQPITLYAIASIIGFSNIRGKYDI